MGTSLKHSSCDILPPVPSGFPRYKMQMIAWFAFFTATYYLVILFFPTLSSLLSLPESADEFCPDEKPCRRGDLFSFEVVSGIALMWCGITGFYCWHVKGVHQAVPQTPEGRLFSYMKEAHLLTAVGTTFQLFDLFISILIPDQRKILMLCHHSLAATVSWYGLNNQYFHYYGGQ